MNKAHQFLLMAAMMGGTIPFSKYNEEVLTPEELKIIEKERKDFEIERKKEQGLKEFNIDGHRVLALNQKNAIRKIKKLMK